MQVSIKSESMMRMMCVGVVSALASKYGFDVNEALESLPIEREYKKEKEEKESAFPVPFKGVDSSCCKSVRMNHGLYTQCQNKAEELCKGCVKEVEKHGKLVYGRIEERAEAGESYSDSKGRKPIRYGLVLKKLKISREEAEAKALEVGVVLNDSDFEVPEKSSKKNKNEDQKRGRPKKNSKLIVAESENEDLFAGLVQNSLSEGSNEDVEEFDVEAISALNAEKEADKAAKEAAKKAAKEAAKEAEKAAKEAEKEAKKIALEAEKAAKKVALEADKEAKKVALEAEKAAKEAEKAAKKKALEDEKAAKEAEKAAKKKALEEKKKALEEKAANKQSSDEKKGKKKVESLANIISGGGGSGGSVSVKSKEEVEESDSEEEETQVSVKKFEFGGKTYLISKTNVLYDMDSEEVGVWNEAKQDIDFAELEEEEEEE